MLRDIVDQVFADHGQALALGAIDADEVMWFADLVAEHRPQHLLEIGMASGMSAGLFAHVLEEHGGKTITTVDYDNTFFGDPTKENGFLVDEIYPSWQEGPVTVIKKPNHIAVDVVGWGGSYEMAFIDANHQHPFPLLDLLAVFPVLTGPKVVVFHDLRLYKDQPVPYGIGPKYVHDQFPPRIRTVAQARGGNIFAVRLEEMTTTRLETIAIDTLLMPWTMRTNMAAWIRSRTRDHMKQHYQPRLLRAFDNALGKFNHPYSIGGA